MVALYVLAGIAGGLSFAVQAPVNAGLGRKTNALMASFISFLGGTLILLIASLIFGSGNLKNIKYAAFWELLGGLYGAYNVCISVVSVPVLGVTLSIIMNMFGQLVASTIIDQFGLLETEAVAVSPLRIIGILIVAAGIVFIYFGNHKKEKNIPGENKYSFKKLVFIFLMFLSGVLGAIQTPTNKALSLKVGSVEGIFISFFVSTIAILIILLIYVKGKLPGLKGKNIKAYQYFGGLFGSVGLFINLITITPLGAALQTICSMVGQVSGALIIDTAGILETERVKISVLRVVGIIIIMAGVILISLSKTL